MSKQTISKRVVPSSETYTFHLYGKDQVDDESTAVAPDDADAEQSRKVRLSNSTTWSPPHRSRYWALLDTIGQMATLPDVHDFAVDGITAEFALELITAMADRSGEPPKIFSTDSDGLVLSWDRGTFRRYLNIDGSDVDLLEVKRGPNKTFCHYEISADDPAARSAWLDIVAGPPLTPTADDDAY